MSNKILVTYATRCGSTAEIAEAIAKILASGGNSVDVLPLKNVSDLNAYQAVVLGSAIRYGQWLPEAVKFAEQHSAALDQRPTVLFTVHGNNRGDDETSQANRQAYLNNIRALLPGKTEMFFAGKIDFSRVSFLERMIGKAVKSEEGDFIDWSAVEAFANGLVNNSFGA